MTAQELAGDDARIVRVMPNTPCLVGETASAMCLGGKATEEDAETVRALFSAVGSIVQVQQRTPCLPAEACVGIVFPYCTGSSACCVSMYGKTSYTGCMSKKDVRRWTRSC